MNNYMAIVKLTGNCEAGISFLSEGKPKSKLNNEDAREALAKAFPGMNVKVKKVILIPEPGTNTLNNNVESE